MNYILFIIFSRFYHLSLWSEDFQVLANDGDYSVLTSNYGDYDFGCGYYFSLSVKYVKYWMQKKFSSQIKECLGMVSYLLIILNYGSK